jgi:carboxyl-terminal processing protease
MKRKSKLVRASILNIILSFVLINVLNIRVFAETNSQAVLKAGKQLVENYYIEELSKEQLNASDNIDGLVKSLNDPYSAYFTEKEYNDFTGSLNHSFAGIGVQVDSSEEGIKVVSVFERTPAEGAGLKAGDIITEADGRSLKGLATEEATTYIRGKVGTKVSLKIKREQTVLSFDVERRQIVLPTVEGSILDNHIGYISITSFGETTGTEFKKVLDNLRAKSPDSYIIDLRYNPGGYMDVAFDIAGYFVGDSVASRIQPRNGEPETYAGVKHDYIIDKPLVFLINGYSASASEILSAAVKDYKKAFFIGEKTYGKGVGQSMFKLPDNSYLKLTTFSFVSPNGNNINQVGVSPDIVIKDDPKTSVDSLAAARILLSGLNAADKSGLVKVSLSQRDFQIKIDTAKKSENINTLNYMTENIFNRDNFYAATSRGWEKLSLDTTVSAYIAAPPVQVVKDDAEKPVYSNKPTAAGDAAIPNSGVAADSDADKSPDTVNESTEDKAAAASYEALPKTGSALDLGLYIGCGIVIILAAVYMIRKK